LSRLVRMESFLPFGLYSTSSHRAVRCVLNNKMISILLFYNLRSILQLQFGHTAPPSDDPISLQLQKLGLLSTCIGHLLHAKENIPLASNSAALLMAMTVRSSQNQLLAGPLHCAKAVNIALGENNDILSYWSCGLLRNIGMPILDL